MGPCPKHMIHENVNPNVLHRIRTLDELHGFIESSRIPRLGCGSTRCAYKLSPKKVIKVAQNESGLAQNEAEVDAYTDPKTRAILAKIFDASASYMWVISELVRPITNEKEFERLTGITWAVFDDLLLTNARSRVNEISLDRQNVVRNKTARNSRIAQHHDINELPTRSRGWMNDVLHIMHDLKLSSNDMRAIDHWGVTNDGRIVILDYGLTRR